MHKHFFTFAKIVDGKRTSIYIDVIVELPLKNQRAAKVIAEHEMAEFREGYQLVLDKVAEQRAEHFPKRVNFLFLGMN